MSMSYKPQAPAVHKGLETLKWTRFEGHGMKQTQALPVTSLHSPIKPSFPLKKQLDKQSGNKSLTSTPAAIFSHQKKRKLLCREVSRLLLTTTTRSH